MIDNPFRKKTASERWAEGARTRLHAAADASHDAGERAKKLGENTAEGVSASAKSAGSALGALIPTVAAAFASGRSKAAHGLDEGVDHGAESVTHGLDAAPEKVDQARDWIVEELLPKLQGMVDDTVDAKNNAAAQGGALSVVAGETVRTPKRKGGVLMVLGLAMLGGAAYFWYTDQKRRQGDPWQRVSSSDDPWAATSGRRAVSAAANPGAGMRSTATTEPAPTAGEKVHLTPSEAAAAREENVDRPERLQQLLDCLTAVHAHFGLPVFVSTHPRTRKRLEALPDWSEPEGIIFSEPLGFHDYNTLQLSAACVLSDSGTIAEESSLLGFPAVTLRDAIERPEALDTGGIMMTGLHAEDCVAAVQVAMDSGYTREGVSHLTPDDYLIDNTSERTVKFILSTAHRHHQWAGIRVGA